VKGERALVTGGAGFIGGHLVTSLLDRGVSVTVLDDLSVGSRERVPAGAELVVGDVRDAALVGRLTGAADVVFHLAARVTIRGSVEGFREDHDVNLGGTLTLLGALPGSPVRRLVTASSMAVYADAADGAPVAEEHSTRPLSPYGASKLAAEHYTRILCGAMGIEQVSLRYFNTWGPGQTPTPYVGVITIFITQLLAGTRPTILGDGLQTRDFVHVRDVVSATVAAMDAELEETVINVGTGRGTTVVDLALAVAQAVGVDLQPVHVEARAEELRCSVADITRARRVLGFSPQEALDLGPLVHWWRDRSGR